MTFKIDTGADVIVVSERESQRSLDGKLGQPCRELRGTNKHLLTVIEAQLRRTGENAMETMETVYAVKNMQTH